MAQRDRKTAVGLNADDGRLARSVFLWGLFLASRAALTNLSDAKLISSDVS